MSRINNIHPVPGSSGRIDRPPSAARWLIPAALIVVALLVAAYFAVVHYSADAYVPAFTAGPRLELSQTQFDYGDVKNNTHVDTEFTLRNVGNRQLQIRQEPFVEAVVGCCPPSAQIGKMELDPGEETKVKFSFSMHEGMDGPHEFSVKLRTNDVEQPEQEVTVLSNWVP
jgi:hypothetical protein